METQLIIRNLSEIDNVAEQFLQIIKKQYPDSRCIIFNAGMGVGKTTFIKALCKALGAVDEASSPTFAIVNDYLCKDGSHIFHFDLYRIKDTEEAMAAGAEDYIYGDDYCLIEWPETLLALLPDNTVNVKIEEQSDGARVMSISSLAESN
ncbi:MAG: tRNA (adenosine(37)-N6)-threonylcarbamoyltransferase complex ATPase subunit type 1 TsaE [Bacteroidales bacterium]|nr:tRNA (adenosine(37)-N6)-threonylcarbamoyltransferase complex ATPase subunit type 1 TsaE [Bacteroidales bacterium]